MLLSVPPRVLRARRENHRVIRRSRRRQGLRGLDWGWAGCLDGFMLFGREGELERVGALLEAARGRRSGALLVVGEPGAGKSALLDAARAEAAAFESALGLRERRGRAATSPTAVPCCRARPSRCSPKRSPSTRAGNARSSGRAPNSHTARPCAGSGA